MKEVCKDIEVFIRHEYCSEYDVFDFFDNRHFCNNINRGLALQISSVVRWGFDNKIKESVKEFIVKL